MSAAYCPDVTCIEDECSPAEPCCVSICGCALTSDCRVYDGGDRVRDLDGTTRDSLYCREHKTEFLS